MRKLKKALSLVLAIALVLGLCTIGAAAIEIPSGVYEGGLTIEYHVTANDLSRLLAVKDYGADAEVDKVTLNFNEDIYVLGPDSLDMLWNAAADTYNYVFSNLSKVQPDCIKSLTVDLADGRTVEVDSDDLTANYIGTGSHIYELSLTEADETYLVTFWAQQGNDLHWTRYSVVAVEKGGTVGNKMPADPDTGNYVFIGWELGSHDGSGSKFTADTVVNSDIDVYARKVSVGGGSAYHVMNPNTELNAYAAAELGAASAEAVTIDSVRVNGQDEEATNPSYITNGWEEHNGVSYFYIYNDDAYAASFDPQYKNTRVPANEVTSITLFCTLNGEQKEVNIGIDELELAVVSDVIVEIRLHKSGDGDFIITASAGENGSISPVGKVSVAAGADQSFSFLPGDGFTVDTLTVNNTTTYENDGSGSFDLTGYTFRNVQANGSIHVTFAADANDNDIPDYKETKYGVTYEFVSGTDGKVLPGSDMPALPSDNSEYLIGITVINKGESTYEAVSVDDGTWTFTGWDANEKVMSKDGITFTGSWTFTPNEPEPGTYTIKVEVINGTAEFKGTNIGAAKEIVVAADEDITITFTPDEGYTLDYATIDGNMLPIPPDGVYTLKQVDSNHTIKVVYAEDKLGGGNDGDGPDGTPDYKQVVIRYVSADENMGTVKPEFEVVTFGVDANGNVVVEDVPLSGSAAAYEGYAFVNWTNELGVFADTASLTDYVLKAASIEAGKIYTYTAHFEKAAPDPITDADLAGVKVVLDCIDNVGHADGNYTLTLDMLKDGSVGPITANEDGTYSCTVAVHAAKFLTKYSSEYGLHELADGQDNPQFVTMTWSVDGGWTADPNELKFNVTSKPDAPTPGEISDLIKDSITVDCVNGEVAHADKVYGLLDGSLVNVEKTDDISIKVTLDATVYQARYNTDTETKHSLADGQSATVTFALNYVDQTWTVAEGELPITIKVVCETPVEPEDAPSLYVTKHDDVAYNESVERGDVVKYTITVENTGNVDLTNVVVEDTLWEEGTVIYVNGFRRVLTGDSINFTFLPVGETITITYYYTVTRADEREGEIVNAVTVKAGDNVTDSDTEKTPVDDGWTPKPDDDDTVYVPNWLNTTDHYAYIVGYEDGTIRPQNNITRAEVATIFFRLLTDNARERYWSTTNDFSDIAAESWYNNAISTLSNMGIINGYEDGTFKPNAPITRAEFTAIATRFFDYEAEYDGAFNDVSARAWYADYVQAAVDMGLVDGYPDGGFHPDAYITRAEACTIVNRVLHRVPHEDHLLSESVMNTWPDNPKSAWYYEDMQEATNSHDYDWIRVDGETVEDWTKKLPERDWSALETEWATAYSR